MNSLISPRRSKVSLLTILAGLPAMAILGCSTEPEGSAELSFDPDDAGVVVLTPDDVEYIPLNPARGDAAPQAGTLWGDIREDVPSGVLLRFADGFTSPPHIHNITYRAVVISGDLHNDDPDAAKMWMGPGSFWIQPAGEVHITAAEPGAPSLSFLEILEGPYLVEPGSEAFDNGERPLNVDASNIVWSDFGGTSQISYLWGDPAGDGLAGALLKIPQRSDLTVAADSGDLKSVIIAGELTHEVADVSGPSELSAGGYFASNAQVPHSVSCEAETGECIIYLRSEGQFLVR